MGELTINEKRKIIRREFKQFNQENGFRFVRPNTLLREQNDIPSPYIFRPQSSASTYPPEFSS